MAKAGTFTKGPDPRRWTKGRPNNFDGLSELTRAIAHEVATKKGGEKVEIDGHLVTITEAVLRQWLQSGEFAKQKAALEIAYGKVPDRVDLTSQGQRITGFAVVSPTDWEHGDESKSDSAKS